MTATTRQSWLAWLGCCLLCLGFGRMTSLVTHDPLLGYANSYEMIRLQACHQVWPADKGVDSRQGTPAAPLRRYTLDRQLDTACFTSTEQLFTGAAIQLARLKNHYTGEKLLSLKTVGSVRTGILALTALLFTVYCYRRQYRHALLANGLVVSVVLADPAITLFFNTFYPTFSAIYCLYLLLAGLVLIASPSAPRLAVLPLLAGLVGLGLSQAAYLPLALLAGLLVSGWLLAGRRTALAACMLLATALPPALVASGLASQQNASMQLADRVNAVGSLLERTTNPAGLLASLSLPEDCRALQGKSGFDPAVARHNPCPALADLSRTGILLALLQQPALLADALQQSLRWQTVWLQDRLGQVENRQSGMAEQYQYSLGTLTRQLPDNTPAALLLANLLLPLVLLASARRSDRPTGWWQLALLVGLLQTGLLLATLSKTGLAGPERYIPLYMPLALTGLILSLIGLLTSFLVHPAHRAMEQP